MFVADDPDCQLPWLLWAPMLEDDSLCSLLCLANSIRCEGMWPYGGRSVTLRDKVGLGVWSRALERLGGKAYLPVVVHGTLDVPRIQSQNNLSLSLSLSRSLLLSFCSSSIPCPLHHWQQQVAARSKLGRMRDWPMATGHKAATSWYSFCAHQEQLGPLARTMQGLQGLH